jgi:hypothetical protein
MGRHRGLPLLFHLPQFPQTDIIGYPYMVVVSVYDGGDSVGMLGHDYNFINIDTELHKR